MLLIGLAASNQVSEAPRSVERVRYTSLSDLLPHRSASATPVASKSEPLIDPPAQLNGHFEVRRLTPSPHDSQASPYPDEANDINRYI